MLDDSYYDELSRRLFGQANWRQLSLEAKGSPTASFRINRQFNEFSCVLAQDFLGELVEQYGEELLPIDLSKGCVSLTARIGRIVDRYGRDFRGLMLTDAEFHEVFRRYGVGMIYVVGFPKDKNSNLDHGRFRVDASGKPMPF